MKKTILLVVILLVNVSLVYGGFEIYHDSPEASFGITLGSVLAVVISWDRNKSIIWAIIHGLFGWLYVIYFALTRK